MKIQELIYKLEAIKILHGDIECLAEDGLDPSDPTPINDVEVWPDNVQVRCQDKQTFAYFCT